MPSLDSQPYEKKYPAVVIHCRHSPLVYLRREGSLKGMPSFDSPATGMNVRTVVVHPLVELLAKPVIMDLYLATLSTK